MTHHLREPDFQHYLDHVLSPNKQNEIEIHLAQCQSCRLEMEKYRELYIVLADDRDMRLPVDFTSRVMSSLPAQSVSQVYTKIWLNVAFIACMMGGLALTVYYTGIDIYLNLWARLESSLDILNSQHLSQYLSWISLIPRAYLAVTLIILISFKLFDRLLVQTDH
jgi:predicted anti-sigma-YlaC factor YlaD